MGRVAHRRRGGGVERTPELGHQGAAVDAAVDVVLDRLRGGGGFVAVEEPQQLVRVRTLHRTRIAGVSPRGRGCNRKPKLRLPSGRMAIITEWVRYDGHLSFRAQPERA